MLLRTVSIGGPWDRVQHDVPTELYGLGANHDFSWYLEGESECFMRSVEDIIHWLAGCQYSSDPDLFNETDYWQHPSTFERLRTGDCEDFALWAWRKLLELGYDAEFVAGRSRSNDSKSETRPWSKGHAWVHFHTGDGALMLDAVDAGGGLSIRPLGSVRELYLPEVSVDGSLKRYVYGGYFLLRKTRQDT